MPFLSPDGKFFVYALAERDKHQFSLWLAQTDGSMNYNCARPQMSFIAAWQFSSDSKHLYFVAVLRTAAARHSLQNAGAGWSTGKVLDESSNVLALA